jgi:hypothetical protein
MWKSLTASGLLLALGTFALPAAAAPLAGANGVTAGIQTSAAEKAAYRRCWWRHGVRHCRWVYDDYGYWDNGYYGYGYGPSVGVFIGGRGGHGGHHGGHRH